MFVDNSTLWKACLDEIQIDLTPISFVFFKNTAVKSIENGVVEVTAPTISSLQYLETRYFMLIKNSLQKRLNQEVSVIFSLQKRPEGLLKEERGGLFENVATRAGQKRNGVFDEQLLVYTRRAGLRDDFTFENFAVSTTNEMAHAAAEAVARDPGRAYNPILIYGGVGVGKTHLMQAVGRQILESARDKKIKYLTGEEFTNEIIDAIRSKTTNQFKAKYRSLDALLLDDVQFIAGKEQIQEEFFHTFNAVLAGGGQVILTSDKPPEQMQKLEERMRSRFQAGLIVDISTPNFELRCAILKIKAEKKGIIFPMNTVEFMAEMIKSAREIEGAILKIKTHLAKNPDMELTPENVRPVLNFPIGETLKKKAVDAAEILAAVCEFFQVKPTAIKGERRVKNLVVPRQILMYLLKSETEMTLEEIGDHLGGRDHTTVMHGVEKIEKLLATDNNLQSQILQVKEKLQK